MSWKGSGFTANRPRFGSGSLTDQQLHFGQLNLCTSFFIFNSRDTNCFYYENLTRQGESERSAPKISGLAFRGDRIHSHLLKSMVIECLLMVLKPLFLYSLSRCLGTVLEWKKVMVLTVGVVCFTSSCLPLVAFGQEVKQLRRQFRKETFREQNNQLLTSVRPPFTEGHLYEINRHAQNHFSKGHQVALSSTISKSHCPENLEKLNPQTGG